MIRHLHHQYYPYRPALSRNITACYLIPVIVTRIQYDTIPRVPEPDAPFILPVPLKFLKMKRTVLENIQKGIRTQYDILRSHQFGLHLFRISPALSVFRTELSFYSDTFVYYLHAPEATRKKHYPSGNDILHHIFRHANRNSLQHNVFSASSPLISIEVKRPPNNRTASYLRSSARAVSIPLSILPPEDDIKNRN